MTPQYVNNENISLSEHYKKLFADYHSRSKEPQLAMQWSLRSINGSPRELMLFKSCLIGITVCFQTFITWLFGINEELVFVVCVGLLLAFMCWTLIAGRQVKTVYRYRIFKTHARLAYCEDISKNAAAFVKGFVGIGLCCLLMVGLMSGSILVLIGPCGMAIVAALRFLDMKIPKKRRWSAPWDEYNFVTVDRKRRFVVTHIEDQTLGFEARLPNDELLEQYLAFLRNVLPPSAQFKEKKWNLSLI